jgi:transposase
MVSTKMLVDTMKLGSEGKVEPARITRNGRRYYPSDYKRQIVESCLVPGASVAGIALARGFNANLVRKWIRVHQFRQAREQRKGPALVPVTVRERVLATVSHTSRRDRRASSKSQPQTDRPSVSGHSVEITIGLARITFSGAPDRELLRWVIGALLEHTR